MPLLHGQERALEAVLHMLVHWLPPWPVQPVRSPASAYADAPAAPGFAPRRRWRLKAARNPISGRFVPSMAGYEAYCPECDWSCLLADADESEFVADIGCPNGHRCDLDTRKVSS